MQEYTCKIVDKPDGYQVIIFPEEFQFPEGVTEVHMVKKGNGIEITYQPGKIITITPNP